MEQSQQLQNKHTENLVTILNSIIKDLDNGIIVKKDLEKFLNNKKAKKDKNTDGVEEKKMRKKMMKTKMKITK